MNLNFKKLNKHKKYLTPMVFNLKKEKKKS